MAKVQEAMNKMAGSEEEEGNNNNQQTSNTGTQSKEIQKLKRQNRMLQNRLNQITQHLQQQSQQTQEPQEEEPEQEPFAEKPDFEEMGNDEVIDYIVTEVSNLVEQKVQPVQQEVESYKKQTNQEKVEQAIKRTASKYDDFWDYAPEVEQIANEIGGNIGPEEAYLIAKSKDKGITKQEAKEQSSENNQQSQNNQQPQQGGEDKTQRSNVNPRSEARKMRGASGEKPTGSSTTHEQGEGTMDRREAINEAMEQLGLKG